MEQRRPPYSSYAAIMGTFFGGLGITGWLARHAGRDPQCQAGFAWLTDQQ